MGKIFEKTFSNLYYCRLCGIHIKRSKWAIIAHYSRSLIHGERFQFWKHHQPISADVVKRIFQNNHQLLPINSPKMQKNHKIEEYV